LHDFSAAATNLKRLFSIVSIKLHSGVFFALVRQKGVLAQLNDFVDHDVTEVVIYPVRRHGRP